MSSNVCIVTTFVLYCLLASIESINLADMFTCRVQLAIRIVEFLRQCGKSRV